MKIFTRYPYSFFKEQEKSSFFYKKKALQPLIKLIMRIQLAFFLILITCLSVQANAQKISMSFKQEALVKVLDEIKKQTGYSFWYSENTLKSGKPVSINIKSATLTDALNLLMKDQPLTYRIVDQTIVITPQVKTVQSNPESNKAIIIRGKVTDKQNKPLEGVSIRIKDSNTGTLTNQNGSYSIEAEPTGVIIFSYVGYQTFEIKINGQTEINMTMVENEAQLQETVIKGYYTTSTKLNTGSVSTLKSSQIESQPVGDPLATLSARIPGLEVIQSTGAPGQAFSLRLRGRNSIDNGTEPLVIIDGIPYPTQSSSKLTVEIGKESPLNSINPADIEEITVLKDADATAIYGSRGANGVILITTKKGQAGATKLDVNVYHSIGKIGRKLDLMNTQQYLEMRREAFRNDGIANPGINDYDLNGDWSTDRYTDWQDVFIGGTARATNANVRLSGGTGSTSFSIGAGYRKEGTVYPGNYFDERKSLQFSLNHTLPNDRFQISLSASYSGNHNKMPKEDFSRLILLAPNAPSLYNEDGSINWQNNTFSNPIAFTRKQDRDLSTNLIGNLNFSYKIIPGLYFRTSLGYNLLQSDENQLTPSSAFNPTSANITISNDRYQSKRSLWILEPSLNYNAQIQNGNLEVLVGTTFQRQENTGFRLFASGFESDELIENITSATSITVGENSTTLYKYNGLYGRIGYSLKDRYVINLTGRLDGSSRFGSGKQFGTFGAIGLAWIFSDEQFFKLLGNVISFGKIRTSVGVTGNDQIIDYQFMGTYAPSNYIYQNGTILVPQRHVNPSFSWEAVKKLEAALELRFYKDRIKFNINWYRNRTGNQLVNYALPAFTGFQVVQANLPAVVQNTGLEFELGFNSAAKRKVLWQTSLNLSVPRNKLVSFPDIETSSYRRTYAVGMPLFVSYRFLSEGIDPQTGTYKIKDLDGDNRLTNDFDRVPIATGTKFFGGIYSTVSYKGFSLGFLLQYVNQKRDIFYYNGIPGTFNVGNENQPVAVLDRWRTVGDAGVLMPKYTTSFLATNQSQFDFSDARLGDASFWRMKNIELYWNAPGKWADKAKIKALKLYLQCQNAFTVSKFKGIDPETGSSIKVPPLRVLAAGLQITL